MSERVSKDRRAFGPTGDRGRGANDTTAAGEAPARSESREPAPKPELTEADKALMNAEPDWERMSQGAKRLLNAKPVRQGVGKVAEAKR